jgi:hypothetical protein
MKRVGIRSAEYGITQANFGVRVQRGPKFIGKLMNSLVFQKSPHL